MLRTVAFLIASFFVFALPAKAQAPEAMHNSWNDLLAKHVDSNGMVDYQGFIKDSAQFNSYIQSISQLVPTSDWSKEDELAYWINVHNAYTVQLLMHYFPLTCVQEIEEKTKTEARSIKFIKIGNLPEMDLKTIENEYIRKKFKDPRINFVLANGTVSAPNLLNEAYNATKLEEQLENQTYKFINDRSKNVLSPKEVQLSKVFSWNTADFNGKEGLVLYISKYSRVKLEKNVKISFLDFNGSLMH